MKLIAVTQRSLTEPGRFHGHDMLDPALSAFLYQCDILPLILPTHLATARMMLEKLKPQGMLFSGGNDTAERKALELMLLNHAEDHQLPLLGICHGMQRLQEYRGLELETISGHVESSQTIFINNRPYDVNSYHDRGTRKTNDRLLVWAAHEDGTVKAIKDKHAPFYGIMWHPERRHDFLSQDIHFIQRLFSKDVQCEQSY